MPLVSVKVLEGVFSEAEKKAVIEGVTDALVAAKGEAIRELVTVLVEEIKDEHWAIGGKRLRAADVEARVGRSG
jgi:4-oxalocrotonate tautomerase